MQVELIHTTTQDGVRLDGTWQTPAASGGNSLGVDAFCFIHGTGGNFYGSTLFDTMAARLLELGYGVLRVNTRGHDGISTAVVGGSGRRLGAAYEVVDDCRHDVAAWVDWLHSHAGPRIGLIGHSIGAVKAIYALSHKPSLPAACLVAISPPRLSYSWFCQGPESKQFLEDYREAESHVTHGKGATLLEVKVPLPMVITAGGYVEKYGPEERYNFLPCLSGLPCPTLLTLGSVEIANNMAFRGLPEVIEPLITKYPQLNLKVIAGADHFYTGVRAHLRNSLEEWLRATYPSQT